MATLNWSISKEGSEMVEAIFNRVRKILERLGESHKTPDKMTFTMDLIACHMNGCPLKLADMADESTDEFSLIHDVFGIQNHINRTNGKLEGFFLPRFAQPEPIMTA